MSYPLQYLWKCDERRFSERSDHQQTWNTLYPERPTAVKGIAGQRSLLTVIPESPQVSLRKFWWSISAFYWGLRNRLHGSIVIYSTWRCLQWIETIYRWLLYIWGGPSWRWASHWLWTGCIGDVKVWYMNNDKSFKFTYYNLVFII